ncbi:MAG: hypothetical protein ABSF69_17100 [Polyangiaceae bacterium]
MAASRTKNHDALTGLRRAAACKDGLALALAGGQTNKENPG